MTELPQHLADKGFTTNADGVQVCVVCDHTEHEGHEDDCPIGLGL